MSSRCLPRSVLGAAAIALAIVSAAGTVIAQNADQAASESGPLNVAVTTLFPGGGKPPPPDPRGTAVDGNPRTIAEGARLFDWYNCSGCHFHGAGGIGPSLMGSSWRYGGQIDQIFASVYQGRPNGMPSWAHKIPDAEIWELAAYVRSLSAPTAANGQGQLVPTPPPAPSALPPPPKPTTTGPAAGK